MTKENKQSETAQQSGGLIEKKGSRLNSVRDFMVHHRLIILVFIHLVLFSAVYWCAFLMRFTLEVPPRYTALFWQSLPFVLALKLGIFFALQSFHGWWRHVNFSDFIALVRSTIVSSSAIIALNYLLLSPDSIGYGLLTLGIPRTVMLNDVVLTIVVIGGLRSVWRVWDERIVPLDGSRIRERALLIGNNFEAARMAHLINGQHQMGTRVLGLVSATAYKKGRRYSDLRVVGDVAKLPELIRQFRAKSVFVISGSVPAKDLRNLLETVSGADAKIKILPKLEEQLRGTDQLPVREVSYDDLLRRKPVNLDLGSIERVVEGKTIMVTGAGGSIGSELCRQLSRFNPEKIVLLGRGENRIYHIKRELEGTSGHINFVAKIANITDLRRMDEIFRTLKPHVVFHAAAHKHVPLVEENVGESIINNVLGSKTVADLSHKYAVERFVLISTDKSVNPTSMMGCTKQMAERYCQSIGEISDTMFISTRFGNVLGSAGSVVPLFQEQIRKGGPITITDERMTRYFMTIPEASQLVIQAASMGNGGEIFVLEMGEPVKILDLAKDLIRLAGQPADSIDIVVRGMRPGEKLYEELYYGDEKSLPTKHDQILSSYSRMFPFEEVTKQVNTLIESAYEPSEKIRNLVRQFVPEYAEHVEKVLNEPAENGDVLNENGKPANIEINGVNGSSANGSVANGETQPPHFSPVKDSSTKSLPG